VSADQRVELAREYLAGARQRDINYMPPSRMMAELAETRRQFGQVLAAVADRGASDATVTGPYETERQAHAASRWEEQGRPELEGRPGIPEANLAQLMDACADAGIAVGAYDSRILHRLAGWEPSTVAVVCGLISRAWQAGGQR
jgi:hypothetical protein